MKQNYTVSYDQYDIRREDDVFSCIGHFPVKGSEIEKYVPVERKEYKGMILDGDDYGPQRFCKLCNIKLVELWDSMVDESVYLHPDNDCEYDDSYMDWDTMWAGVPNHDNLTLDDMKEVFKTRVSKSWMAENKAAMTKIYSENKDAAGKDMENEVRMPVHHDDDGNVVEVDMSDIVLDDLWNSPIHKDDTMRLTKEENKFLKFFHKHVLSWHYRTKSRGSMADCVNKAYRDKRIREHLYEHCLEIAMHVKNTNFWHPRTARMYKYRGLHTWAGIERALLDDDAASNVNYGKGSATPELQMGVVLG